MTAIGTEEDQSNMLNHSTNSNQVILSVQDAKSSVTSFEKLDQNEMKNPSDDSIVRQDQFDSDHKKEDDVKDDKVSLPPSGARPEVDRGIATRFINHAIRTQSIPIDSKRKLEQDEIEEQLERGRSAPRPHLPEIRQVIKGGGWADEDDSDSSDEEDLKVFD